MDNLFSLFVNLADLIPQFIRLLGLIAVLIGLTLIVQAIMGAARKQDYGPQATWSGPIIRLLIGVFLLSFGPFIAVGTVSLFGGNANEMIDRSLLSVLDGRTDAAASEEVGQVINALQAIIVFIGLLAILRGLIMANRLHGSVLQNAGGQGSTGAAITHVIAGICAVNIGQFAHLLANLFV